MKIILNKNNSEILKKLIFGRLVLFFNHFSQSIRQRLLIVIVGSSSSPHSWITSHNSLEFWGEKIRLCIFFTIIAHTFSIGLISGLNESYGNISTLLFWNRSLKPVGTYPTLYMDRGLKARSLVCSNLVWFGRHTRICPL